METVSQLALLNLTSTDRPALHARTVKSGTELHALLSSLSLLQPPPLIQPPLDQLLLQPQLAPHQVQDLHAQLALIGINNNSDAFLALTDAQAVFLVILAPLVPQDFSLTQALDSALKFVVMERDLPLLVMMVTLSMVMVAAAHVKLKTDSSALEDHLLQKIPAAKASQLRFLSAQVDNPTNGEESFSMLEPTISLLLSFNLLMIAQTTARMSLVPRSSVEIVQLFPLLLHIFLLPHSVFQLLSISKKNPSEYSQSKSE